MSEENVEKAQRSIDAFAAAFERGELDSIQELVRELVHPDVVYEPLRAPIEGAYRGHEGFQRFLADTDENFEVFRPNITDIRDLGERVLAIGTLHIRPRGGGPEMDVPTAGIATYRDGRLIHWKDFGDRRKALEAAGLAE